MENNQNELPFYLKESLKILKNAKQVEAEEKVRRTQERSRTVKRTLGKAIALTGLVSSVLGPTLYGIAHRDPSLPSHAQRLEYKINEHHREYYGGLASHYAILHEEELAIEMYEKAIGFCSDTEQSKGMKGFYEDEIERLSKKL